MVSRTFAPYLLLALIMLHQAWTGPGETFTNEPSMYNVRADVDVSFTTGREIPNTTNTPADTGGTPNPETPTYVITDGPDLSITTGEENMVTINTMAETGRTSHPETSMYIVTSVPEFTPGEEIHGTTIAPTGTGGTSTDFTPGEETHGTTISPTGTGGTSTDFIPGEETHGTTIASTDAGGILTNFTPGEETHGTPPIVPTDTGGTSTDFTPGEETHGTTIAPTDAGGTLTNFTSGGETYGTTIAPPDTGATPTDFTPREDTHSTTIATTDTGGTPTDFTLGGETYGTTNTPTDIGGTSTDFTPGEEIHGTTIAATDIGGTTNPGDQSCLLDSDCPPFSSCVQLDGLHLCLCDLGLYSHPDLGCVTARTFPARIAVSALRSPDGANEKRSKLGGPISREVADLFGEVFGHIEGYLSSSVTDLQPNEGHVTIAHFFSLLHVVTEEVLQEALTVSAQRCDNGSCISLLGSDIYHSLSLCDVAWCDSASSICTSRAGLATCECRDGYYKFNPNDRSCRACDSGFRWSEGRCESCPLGYGGFNCQEAFLLAVIVESCAGCVLLVSQIAALFYYIRRKKKPKPTFMDSLVLGGSSEQPALKLPRAQFSWTREWEWTDPSGKIPESIRREGTVPERSSEPSDIQMRTFGSIPRASVTSPHRGSHNLAFISDN